MKKRIFVFLTVCLLTACSAAWADYWDEGHEGTASSPYIIDTIADLQALRDRVNNGTEPEGKYYKLTKNLNISSITDWVPIGDDKSRPFTGHFDGNGKSIHVNISRSNGDAGLFDYVNTEADTYAVKNLTVSGTAAGRWGAGIVLDLYSGIIDNCTFTGTLSRSTSYYCEGNIGGIVQYMANGKITNCTVSATISRGGYDTREYAGGIVGVVVGGSIENCKVQGTTISGFMRSGGIAGDVQMANFDYIKDCTFSGTIDTISSRGEGYSGGIVGRIEGGNLQNNHVIAVSNSVTEIKSTKYAGGIAGRIGESTVLENCDVSSLVTVIGASDAMGGIVGLMNASTVRNNQTYALVSGDIAGLGGVVGKLDAASYTIKNNIYNASLKHGIGVNSQGVASDEGCSKASGKITITTGATLPAGILKAAYSMTFEANGGVSSYTWTVSKGTLPAGLTLNKTTGVLSGKPTASGAFSFTVKAVDKNKAAATKAFKLAITKPVILGTLNNGVVKVSYSAELEVNGGTEAYTWTISSGKLPTGLALGKSTGKITGKPTAAGTFKFTVKVTDANKAAATKAYTVTITKPVISGTLPDGALKGAYSAVLTATGGTSAYTWTISSGKLPTGLSLGKTNGKITGKPTATGTFKFTVKVTDKNKVTATKAYTVKVTKTAMSGSLTTGTIEGYSYYGNLTVSGGTAAYKWTISKGKLPTGLKLTYSGTTATISGTPTKAGSFSFTVKVTDKNSVAATKAFSIYVVSKSLIQTATKNVKSASATVKATSSNKKTSQSLTAAVPNIMTNNPSNSQGNGTITLAATLNVASDDVIETYEGKDSDLVKVKANTELTFIIGEWGVDVSELTVYVDDKPVEGLTVEEGKFTLTTEMVHSDFKVSVKAQSDGVELESEEVYIISE